MFDRRELEQARYQHAQYFLNKLRYATVLYDQNRVGTAYAIEQDWAQIQQGQTWSAEHTSDHKAAQLCNAYAETGIELLELSFDAPTRVKWYQGGLIAAQTLNLRSAEGIHCRYLGQALRDLGEYDQARHYLLQALEIAQNDENERETAELFLRLGQLVRRQGHHDEALQYYESSLTIFRAHNWSGGVARVLNDMGRIMCQRDLSQAEHYFQESLAISEEIGQQRTVASSLYFLGTIMEDWGQFYDARTYYQRSLAIKKAIGAQQSIAHNIVVLGNIDHWLGDYDESERKYQKALALYEQYGIVWQASVARHNLGYVAYLRGDYDLAKQHLERTLEERKVLDDQVGVALVLSSLGFVALDSGEYDLAHQRFDAGLNIARSAGAKVWLLRCQIGLGATHCQQENREAAYTVFIDALQIASQVNATIYTLELLARIADCLRDSDSEVAVKLADYLTHHTYSPFHVKHRTQHLLTELEHTGYSPTIRFTASEDLETVIGQIAAFLAR